MLLSAVLRRTGLAVLALLATAVHAQTDGFWSDVPTAAAARSGAPTVTRALRLDRPAMAARLAEAPPETAGIARGAEVPLPMPGGGVQWFRVVESPVMAPALQARYPQIRTYVGQGITEPSATVRISLTPAGFAAQAFTPAGALYVDAAPAAGAQPDYVAYFSRDQVLRPDQQAALRADDVLGGDAGASDAAARAAARRPSNGATLRTYRLALSATAEYSAFFGGTVPGALAAMVTAMNRVNGVYERDLSVRMELVANTDRLIFVGDFGRDPFTNDTTKILIDESQIVANQIIGTANYDIGHNFSTGAGGLASSGVCVGSRKGQGVTGVGRPTGDGFYIDYVAHEMGHQFSADHTFNGGTGNCAGLNRQSTAAYEPGSGSTIMAYAGICGAADLQRNSDSYFHTYSLQQIAAYVTTGSGSTCGTATPTGNDLPVVTAPTGLTIPVSTPFTLTGAATDATPAALTFAWEEFDRGATAAPANGGVPTGVPFFRSFNPSPSPARTFPQMSRLLAGIPPVRGEALPNTTQALTFRLTARDNRAGGGAFSDVTVTLQTDVRAGPFVVTAPAGAGLSFGGGSEQSVDWNVANTAPLGADGLPDADGVDVETVQILYSADGGATFTVLVAATPNDGQETVTIPVGETTRGRIMVAAVGNVFFNLAPATFAVTPGTAGEARLADEAVGLSPVAPNPAMGRARLTLTQAAPGSVIVAVYDALGRRVAVLFDGAAGVEQLLSLDASGLPAGVYVVRAQGTGVQAAQRFTVVR